MPRSSSLDSVLASLCFFRKHFEPCLQQVSVIATPSNEYTLTPLSENEYTSCLCGSERKTLSWTLLPSVLGKAIEKR